MARSAEDCWLVFQAIADRPPRRATVKRRPRIGYAPADFELLAARSARPAFTAALATFRTLDLTLREAAIPADLPYDHMVRTIFNGEAASIFGDLIGSPRLDELVDDRQKAGLRAALKVTARDYLDAQRARVRVQRAFAELFERVDLLLSYGRPRGAPPIDKPIRATAPGMTRPDRLPAGTRHNAGLIAAGNLAGLPALTFPCGFDPDGLPLALQLVGPPDSEALLVDLGSRFQSATDWHQRRPPTP